MCAFLLVISNHLVLHGLLGVLRSNLKREGATPRVHQHATKQCYEHTNLSTQQWEQKSAHLAPEKECTFFLLPTLKLSWIWKAGAMHMPRRLEELAGFHHTVLDHHHTRWTHRQASQAIM